MKKVFFDLKVVTMRFLAVLSCIVMSSAAFASFDPNSIPRIGAGTRVLFAPQFYFAGFDSYPPNVRTDPNKWVFEIVAGMPINRYFHSGFLFSLLPKIINTTNGLGSFWADLSGIVRPNLPFSTPIGHFSLYLNIPAGVTVTFWGTNDPASYSAGSETLNTRKSGGTKDRHPSELGGVGFNAASYLGFEYFPVDWIGLYVEGGGGYHVIWNPLMDGNKNSWDFWRMEVVHTSVGGGLHIIL